MSHLLGNEECLKNLRFDVEDISRVLTEIFSRVGPLAKISSWKFPDKVASELDVDDLLERYSFCEDDLDNQVSHFSLLELLVDRLLLLLHCAAAFHDQINNNGSGRLGSATTNVSGDAPTSAGLIVKMFWLKIVKVFSLVQQLNSEAASTKRENLDLVAKVADLKSQVDKAKESGKRALAIIGEEMARGDIPVSTVSKRSHSVSTSTSTSVPAIRVVDDCGSVRVAVDALHQAATRIAGPPCPHIGSDSAQRGCQTIDTSFAPCAACHEAQNFARTTGTTMMDICKRLEVPPSAYAAAQRGFIEREGWLTAKELSESTEEQSRCLTKLGTFLEAKLKEIQALKDVIDKMEGALDDEAKKKDQLASEFQGDRHTWVIEKKNYNNKLEESEKKCAERIKDMQTYVNKVLQEKDKANIEQRKAKDDTAVRDRLIANEKDEKKRIMAEKEELEGEMTRMRKKMESMEDDMKKVLKEKDLAEVEKESAQKAMRKMDATMSVLDKKATSFQSQEETFLSRIDRLSEENEALVRELEEAEARLEKLSGERETGIGAGGVARVEEAERRMRALEKQVNGMASDRKESEAMIAALKARLQEAKEQQRLLVAFPDLHGPVNLEDSFNSTTSSVDYSESDDNDVASDMKKQLKANALRIEVLRDENDRLHEAIVKMNGTVEEAKVLGNLHRAESKSSVAKATSTVIGGMTRSVSQGNIALWTPSQSHINFGKMPNVVVNHNNHTSANAANVQNQPHKSRSAAERLMATAPPPRRSISQGSTPTTPRGQLGEQTSSVTPGIPMNSHNMSDEFKENITSGQSLMRPTSFNLVNQQQPLDIPQLPPKKSASKISVAWGRDDMKVPSTIDMRSATLPRNIRVQSAPSSAKHNGSTNEALDAYRQLKQTGYVKANGARPPSHFKAFASNTARNSKTIDKKLSGPSSIGVVSCPKCDKMYTSTKDLDVHKLYCLNAYSTNF